VNPPNFIIIITGNTLEQSNRFQVQVLLATFNGENYLQQFLDSLALQQEVDVELLVSDDSSTDNTLSILESNKARFSKCTILTGPGQGPMANFLYLAHYANAEYVAFADQDDLWDMNHLNNSCLRLVNFNNVPALSFSRVNEFSALTPTRKLWPSFNEIPSIELFFAQNFARGCTIVFNKALLYELLSYQPRHAIMHDWWILLIAYSIGEVTYSDTPEVLYRVHENNFTKKVNQNRFFHILSNSKKKWEPHLQLRELALNYGYKMNNDSYTLISNFVNGCSGSFSRRFRYVLNVDNQFREKRVDDLLVRARILFQPFFELIRKVDE
jgi:glycosyltransferase involved in cell wall biosynthesis